MTYLEANGLTEQFHRHTRDVLYGNNVWAREAFATWDPARSFSEESSFLFSVIASRSGVTTEEVVARVAAYLS